MQFEVIAEDGRTALVEAADWMMALVRGVDRLGDKVSGFSCATGPSGVVHVEDHGSGKRYVVQPAGTPLPAPVREPSPPPTDLRVTEGPTPRRLMDPRRRRWSSLAPRPLWVPERAPRAAPSQHPRAQAPPNLAETLFEAAQVIKATTTLDGAFRVTLERTMALVPAEAFSVLRGGEADQSLVFVAVLGGAGESLIGRTVPWGKGIAGAACVGGVPIVVRDAQSDPRHDSSFDAATGFRTEGLMAVPVRTDSGFYGVLEAINPKDEGGFQPWHVDAAESLARALADRLSGRL